MNYLRNVNSFLETWCLHIYAVYIGFGFWVCRTAWNRPLWPKLSMLTKMPHLRWPIYSYPSKPFLSMSMSGFFYEQHFLKLPLGLQEYGWAANLCFLVCSVDFLSDSQGTALVRFLLNGSRSPVKSNLLLPIPEWKRGTTSSQVLIKSNNWDA